MPNVIQLLAICEPAVANLTAVLVPGAIVNGIECTEALWVGSSETVAAYETWPDRRPVRIINIGCVEYTQKPDWCEYHDSFH